MIEVKVIKKFINILPIQDLINQNESLVDDIWFIIDNYVDGIDFSDWNWSLYYKTSLDNGYIVSLDSQYDSENEKIKVHWLPDQSMTSKSGYMNIQIIGTKEIESELMRWSTAPASIHINSSLQ